MKLELLKHSRSRLLAIILTAIMAIIVLRLFYLQVIQHNYYVELANKEQVTKLTIPAKRGLIYALDRNSPVQLVMNQEVYTLFADPKSIDKEKIDAIEQTVKKVAGAELLENVGERLRRKDTQYVVLGRQLTLRQAEMIKKENFAGIGFQQVARRVYPEGGLAAQTLGFVNYENKGQYGVEEALNDRLTGKDGMLKSVTDIAKVPLSIGKDNIREEPKDGDNIVLSIDRNVQAKSEEALLAGLRRTNAEKGSVIVMNPNNGQVLAMANLPAYQPAEYAKVQDAGRFVNSTISVPFEPASVIKTLTMATGVDRGVINPDSTYYNTDKITVEDRTIENALKGVTGTITMQDVLNNSLNTGTVTVVQRLGDGKSITRGARDTMYDYFANRFRLGKPTGIQLAGEQRGTLYSPDQPEGNAVRYSNMSFGQGMDVTMLQVCSAFNAIVNGGVYHDPTVVAGTYNDEQFKKEKPRSSHRAISTDTAAKVRSMIHQTRVDYKGTGDASGYYIGGKTGTSQTIRNGQYVFDQTIGTYIGFGGTSKKTEYVIMVQVAGKNMNLQGNVHAMPIFTDISNWMLQYLQVSKE